MRVAADAGAIRCCPAGSIVARDNGTVWRKSTIGDWRSEFGMQDRLSNDQLASLITNAGKDTDFWLLRWGWKAN